MSNTSEAAGTTAATLLIITAIISWLTHVVVTLLQGKYLLLLAGAIIFPVGCIHGAGILLGVDW